MYGRKAGDMDCMESMDRERHIQKMGKADFMGFLNRNELRFISKVSQKLVKTQNRGKMSTNRGGESGLDFD